MSSSSTPPTQNRQATGVSQTTDKSVLTECIEEDVDLYGSDLSEKPNVESAESCQRLCSETDECQFWTWGTEKAKGKRAMRCYLKKAGADQGKVKHEGLVSGKKSCD